MAVSPVFYQVKPQNLPLYIDLGLNLSKLGEEARVPLDTFSLEGAARADLRQAHRRASRDGAQFEVVPRTDVAAVLPELRAVSDAWLAEKNTAEKRFSLGFFDERYLMTFRLRGGAPRRRHRRLRQSMARRVRRNYPWISCATAAMRRRASSIIC